MRGVRIVTKSGRPFGAQIIPLRRLDVKEVRRLQRHLTDVDGRIVTSALSSIEQDGFREAGFVELEALHLLRHDLHTTAKAAGAATLRIARRSDLPTVLDIDQRSFDDFWSLDRAGVLAARRATPVHRYVVATLDESVVGYAIAGRSGRASFLQRLGVHPNARGKGVGSQLVIDSLGWARNAGAASMLVNTQVRNETACRLYLSLGFALDDNQLKVLEWHR